MSENPTISQILSDYTGRRELLTPALNAHCDCLMESHKPEPRPHSHYFKNVSHLQTVDVYRVLELFGVTDPCLQHAAKKILCAGGRGAKDTKKDIQEAIDSLNRRLEMYREDGQ